MASFDAVAPTAALDYPPLIVEMYQKWNPDELGGFKMLLEGVYEHQENSVHLEGFAACKLL